MHASQYKGLRYFKIQFFANNRLRTLYKSNKTLYLNHIIINYLIVKMKNYYFVQEIILLKMMGLSNKIEIMRWY